MAELSGLHILIVPAWWPSPEEPISGIFHTDYARTFASAGARVGVVFPDLVSVRHWGRSTEIHLWPKLICEEMHGIPIVRIRGLHTALRMPWMQMTRFRCWLRRGLDAYVERFGRPDLLHAMCAIPAAWACTTLEDPLARRVVVTEHTGFFSTVITRRTGRSFALRGLHRAAAVVAVSAVCRDEIHACGVQREIQIRGNPVCDDFLQSPFPPRRSEGRLRGLFVGRMTEAKGVGELAAAATVLAAEQEIEWHFAGDGPMAETVRDLFASAGLADRLMLHGPCDRSTVVDLMARCDFLTLPSHGETFGMAVAEALCMGLPVVTTRGTACADFVGDQDGVLVNMRDVDSLCAGFRSLIGKLAEYDRGAIAERARSRFSGRAVARWYSELFHQVTDREKASGSAAGDSRGG